MVRAPYPARIAAGLIVVAIEETRRLPTRLFTLPMTAVSQTLQAGMRAQQQIAELAIKGDEALDMIFDKPDEQPEWARFDEDELTEIDPGTPIETAEVDVPDTEAAPANSTADTDGPSDAAPSPSAASSTVPRADAGRFALYSSAPADLVAGDSPTTDGTPDVDKPEIVEFIEYDNLTLAQLRAKLRAVDLDDLTALAAYEAATKNRAPFVTMLDNRITAQNKRSPNS